MPSYEHSAAARKEVVTFARSVRPPVAELNVLSKDPDLNAEAKARRAEPMRTQIREIGEAAVKKTREIASKAIQEHRQNQPAAIRRREAFKSPEKAAAYRALFQGMPASDVMEFARIAAAERNTAASYALASVIAEAPSKFDETQRQAIMAELDAPLSTAGVVTLRDAIVAHSLAVKLESHVESLVNGGRIDPERMLASANREVVIDLGDGKTHWLTTADLKDAYEQAGVPMSRPAESLELEPDLSLVQNNDQPAAAA